VGGIAIVVTKTADTLRECLIGACALANRLDVDVKIDGYDVDQLLITPGSNAETLLRSYRKLQRRRHMKV
jgi:hypothetical protein